MRKIDESVRVMLNCAMQSVEYGGGRVGDGLVCGGIGGCASVNGAMFRAIVFSLTINSENVFELVIRLAIPEFDGKV